MGYKQGNAVAENLFDGFDEQPVDCDSQSGLLPRYCGGAQMYTQTIIQLCKSGDRLLWTELYYSSSLS